MKFNKLLVAIALAACANGANAAASLNLANYQLTGNYALDTLGGMGLEASAVTYAHDRNSLFVVGDEGLGVVEVSLTGQTLGAMAFNWAGTGSTNNDAEGLTYLGNGQMVVVDERPQIAYQFGYIAGGSVALNNQPKVAITGSTASVGNVGTEGISYDSRDGSFYSVKQDNPAQLRKSTLNFAVGGGTASTSILFSGPNSASSLFGLNSLSDLQTLSSVNSLANSAAADNLLILSLDSKKLAEVSPFSGQLISSFDLANLTTQAIEGVTVDHLGNIYLVAENNGTSFPNSRLFVLTPTAVPVPGAVWMFGSALLGMLGLRRRKA
jgi:uncharacterized protein YjiK